MRQLPDPDRTPPLFRAIIDTSLLIIGIVAVVRIFLWIIEAAIRVGGR